MEDEEKEPECLEYKDFGLFLQALRQYYVFCQVLNAYPNKVDKGLKMKDWDFRTKCRRLKNIFVAFQK